MEIIKIAWAAGLLEGEGCFSIHRKAYKRKEGFKICYTPIIDIGSIDEDTVRRIARMFHAPVCTQSYKAMKKAGGNFQKHSTKIYSSRAIGWMMTVYSFMSIRRKARITEIIKDWKSR